MDPLITDSRPEDSTAPRRKTRVKRDSLKSTEANPGCSNTSQEETTPLRRSARKKSLTFRVKDVPEVKNKAVYWTKSEKARLLEGMKIAGDRNIADLAKFVPTKKSYQIEYYVNSLRRRSQKIVNSEDGYSLLELWSKKIKALTRSPDPSSFDPLPIGLLLISLFEEFPLPSQVCGINFRSLYEYLFCLISEQPLPTLDRKSKQFLHQSLKELESDISQQSESLLNALFQNDDLSGWPYDSKAVNPLSFPKLEVNLEE